MVRGNLHRSANLAIGALLLCVPSLAQNPQLETKNGRQFPTVVFTSVLWTADPAYYSVAIDSSGTATYQSAANSIDRTGVPYTVEFAVSDKTRRATFNLAQGLDWFRDEITLSVGAPQTISVRTLAYHDIQFNNQITYSSSSNQDVQELTSIFEELSETLEFGRRLIYFHEYDRDALAPELQRLQASADMHHVREMQALVTVLNSVAADKKLSNATRERADGLLKQARAAAHR